MVATGIICPKRNNTRPYSQITTETSVKAIDYKYLTHKEKANLDSQEVHDITQFESAVCIPRFMSTQDLSFSLKSINLYYFNIIKKYTSHMYDLTKEIKINHKWYIELLSITLPITYHNKHYINAAKIELNKTHLSVCLALKGKEKKRNEKKRKKTSKFKKNSRDFFSSPIKASETTGTYFT